MDSVPLYSERSGRKRSLSIQAVNALIWKQLVRFRKEGYWDGTLFATRHSTDFLPTSAAQPVIGSSIPDSDSLFLRELGTDRIWYPLYTASLTVPAELDLQSNFDLLFDLIELLHRSVSDKHELGEFRVGVNRELAFAEPAYELLADGRIVAQLTDDQRALVETSIPDAFAPAARVEIETARTQFTRRNATTSEKKSALQLLYHAFERERDVLKNEMMTGDEAMLFQLANKFAIRHSRDDQHVDYDTEIWYEWVFYVYMATVFALGRVIDRNSSAGEPPSSA